MSAADFPIEPGEGEAEVETEARSGPFAGRTAWARNLEAPLRDFLRTETGSAAILFIGAVAAMVWINVDAASYNKVWNTVLSVRIGGTGVSQDLRHWVNNGLMTLFFFVVGLEARREFDLGDLRDRRRLALPFVAGLGGMIVPIVIFLAINGGAAPHGAWGTAMSTDTAFALGMLALVGARYPTSLRAFILTVAVVDDLVALVVIAIAFTTTVHAVALAVGITVFILILVLRNRGVHNGGLYLALGMVAWVAFLESGDRPDRRRPGHGPADDRLPGRARGPGAGHRPVPRLPRAADLGAAAIGAGRPALGDLAQRALAADVPSLHQLRGRAAVRAGQRGLRDQRLVPEPRLRVGRSRSGSSSPTSWASRSG